MGPFRKILTAVDFDENSMAALNMAAAIARSSDARIFVMHVVPVAMPCPPAEVDFYLERERRARERLMQIAIERLVGLEYEVTARAGDPAIGILNCAEEIGADLIVIATFSARGAAHEFRASVAERVIRQARCPVLATRTPHGGDIESVRAQMTPDPVCVAPDTSLIEARAKMRAGGFRFVPVVDEGHLVGVITDRDIRAYSEHGADIETGAVMTREAVTVTPDVSIREVARLLVECDVNGLPVLENGRVVGVITATDVLKALAC